MTNKVKVLNITRVFRAAGIESFIMNMYRNINRDKVKFDFLVMKDEPSCYDEEINELGGKKYSIDIGYHNTMYSIILESIELYKFLKKHPYDIVHIHYTTPLRALYLLAAKLAGVKVRIYHSHSAEVSGKSAVKLMFYDFFRKKITKWGTHWFACSETAANWMFEKKLILDGKVKILHNGIDTNRFKFDKKHRDVYRKKLDIENYFVLMHTGRFLDQKNHSFLIDIFNIVKTNEQNSKLLLLGAGKLVDTIKEKVKRLGLEDDVLFLGVQENVEDYLSASDCFVMPSLYEGLPVAAVEAECNGLPCFLSDRITDEVKLNSNVVFLSLNDNPKVWASRILEKRNTCHSNTLDQIKASGYDVVDGARKLEDIYISVL
ncbi:glycosyltransferase family 1 protein [Streptococcus sp.]